MVAPAEPRCQFQVLREPEVLVEARIASLDDQPDQALALLDDQRMQALPLTALTDGLRAVLLDGAGLRATAGYVANMLLWATVTFAVSLKIFRWT